MTASTPLINASESELTAAVGANYLAWFRSMAHALGGDLEVSDRLFRYHCSPGSPIFKGVWGARLAPEESDAAIDDTIAWFKARNAPFFFWWIDEDAQPADLSERLKARGFGEFEIDATAMVGEIDRLNWKNPRPPGFRLDRVASDEQMLQMKRVFLESFGIPEWAGQAWVDAMRAIGFERAPWTILLGTLDGEPVSFGLLYCGAGVAGLQGLGTLPAYRGRGIGSATQLERLRIAHEMGYHYAVLTASKMGRSPYLKLGFRDTGKHLSRYIWRNA